MRKNKKYEKILVVGAGGIGFWVSMMVQFKTNKLYVCDFDIAETHNQNRVPYRDGEVKVYELEDYIKVCEYFPIAEPYTETILETVTPEILIDCTDNLKTQRKIYVDCDSRPTKYIRVGSFDKYYTVSTYVDFFSDEGEENHRCGVHVPQKLETQIEAAYTLIKVLNSLKSNYRNFHHRLKVKDKTILRRVSNG